MFFNDNRRLVSVVVLEKCTWPRCDSDHWTSDLKI